MCTKVFHGSSEDLDICESIEDFIIEEFDEFLGNKVYGVKITVTVEEDAPTSSEAPR